MTSLPSLKGLGTTPTPSPNTAAILDAIKYNETRGVKGDPYASSQFSGDSNLGKAMGAWRVTEGELKTYGKRYLGRVVTPQEFLGSPQLQTDYMTGKVNSMASKGVSTEDIIAKHRGGQGATATQYPGYVKAAMAQIPSVVAPVEVKPEKKISITTETPGQSVSRLLKKITSLW